MFCYTLLGRPLAFMQTNKQCPVCGLNLEQEPGYYYGAMFVSYAFAILELALVLLVMKLLSFDLTINAVMLALTVVFLLLSPANFRWGRAGWIAIFIKYDAGSRNSA